VGGGKTNDFQNCRPNRGYVVTNEGNDSENLWCVGVGNHSQSHCQTLICPAEQNQEQVDNHTKNKNF
jgi:hypothetical protein